MRQYEPDRTSPEASSQRLQADGGSAPSIAFIIPAHNEAPTVAGVVDACRDAGSELAMPHEVVVISDCSTDETEAAARFAGARVQSRAGSPSKAAALTLGAASTESDFLFLVDADCLGLTGATLVKLARPVLRGEASMSVGVFDYKLVSRLVQRFPWSAGERVLHRSLFPLDDARLDQYNVEILLNEAVGESGGNVASMRMDGVVQRTKRDKFGALQGLRKGLSMWRQVSSVVPSINRAAYRRYMENVELWDDEARHRQRRLTTATGYVALRAAAALLGTK
jgi:hypothetical protein